MRTKIVALALCIAFANIPGSVAAQEMKAERETNVTYYRVEMVKFHHGKRPRAAELVDKYFAPTDREMGGTVIDLHLMTGEWDFITLFPMSGGPADLTYTTSPEDVRFMGLLAKRAGGADAAKKLIDEWDTLVAKREWHIGHTHNSPK